MDVGGQLKLHLSGLGDALHQLAERLVCFHLGAHLFQCRQLQTVHRGNFQFLAAPHQHLFNGLQLAAQLFAQRYKFVVGEANEVALCRAQQLHQSGHLDLLFVANFHIAFHLKPLSGRTDLQVHLVGGNQGSYDAHLDTLRPLHKADVLCRAQPLQQVQTLCCVQIPLVVIYLLIVKRFQSLAHRLQVLFLCLQVALRLHSFAVNRRADHFHALAGTLVGWVSAKGLDGQRDAELLVFHGCYLYGNQRVGLNALQVGCVLQQRTHHRELTAQALQQRRQLPLALLGERLDFRQQFQRLFLGCAHTHNVNLFVAHLLNRDAAFQLVGVHIRLHAVAADRWLNRQLQRLFHDVQMLVGVSGKHVRTARQLSDDLRTPQLIAHIAVPAVFVHLHQRGHPMVLWRHAFLAAGLKRLQRDVAALAPRHTAILRLLQLGLHVVVVGVHQIGHALHLRLRLSGRAASGLVHLHQLVDHQFPFGFPFHHGQQTFHYFVYRNLRYPILVFPYLIVLQEEHRHSPAHPVGAERDRRFLEPFRSVALEIMVQGQQHGVATRISRSLATLHQLFRRLLSLRRIGQSQGQRVGKV